jgi:hypothetical protein
MNATYKELALKKFSGCDNSEVEAGTPENPSIWVLGLEHGIYKSVLDANYEHDGVHDDSYSIDIQMKWPYNRNAFKLLAAMDPEYGVTEYRNFAEDKQPFVKGSRGYFKGNLYPFACSSFNNWTESAVRETGFKSKRAYLKWCQDYRLPEVNHWIDQHKPKVVLGIGITQASAFSTAVFGESKGFEEEHFEVNGHKKRILCRTEGDKKLAVLPHLSGGRHGLNSWESIELAGKFLREFISS